MQDKKQRKLQRYQSQSDLCSSCQNPAMKAAGNLLLTNKNWASCARQEKMDEAIAEQVRRQEQRKVSGQSRTEQ